MFEVIRALWAPKTYGYEQEYEDAANWNPSRGVAAICDGVSSAIFSRDWADILTTAIVTDPPVDLTADGSFRAWLDPHRKAWSQRIDLPNLKWNQLAKLNQIGGGWGTLLWLQLEQSFDRAEQITSIEDGSSDLTPVECSAIDEGPENGIWKMTCHAIGDCNVFIVRDGTLRLSHPMQSSSAYAQKPQAVCSRNHAHDGQLSILTGTFDCKAGDRLVMCTDAVGQWLWTELEQHSGEVDWQRLERLSDEEWRAEIEQLRGDSRMPIDDCTLVILRVGASIPSPLASPEEPIAMDVAPEIVAGSAGPPATLTSQDVATVENAPEPAIKDPLVDTTHDEVEMGSVTDTASVTTALKDASSPGSVGEIG